MQPFTTRRNVTPALRIRRGLFLALAIGVVLVLAAGCGRTEDPKNASDEQVDLLAWEVVASHPLVEADATTSQMVHISVDALSRPDGDRRPLNLSIVVDHSGSMSGEQLDDARQALRAMLNTLNPWDRVSVVAFSSKVEVLQEQARWASVDRAELEAALAELEPTGTTAMSPALHTALNNVQQARADDTINRIVLLSDGAANAPQQLPHFVSQAAAASVAVTTMGLGPWYDEKTLAMIADSTGGRYRFIETSKEIDEHFMAELRAIQDLVVRNARVELVLGPDVVIEDAYGLPISMNQRTASIALGNLSTGEGREIGLRLGVKARGSGAHVEIMDAKLVWQNADGANHATTWHESSVYVGAEATSDLAEMDASVDMGVVERVGRLQAALELEQALDQIQAGALAEGRKMLGQAARRYKKNNVVAPVSGGGVPVDQAAMDAAEALESEDEADRNMRFKRARSSSRSVYMH